MEKPREYERSTFARNVVLKRYDLGISAMKLAEDAKMPYPTLRDIESGRTQGNKRSRDKIAKALGTTVDALNTPSHAHHTPNNGSKNDLLAALISVLPALNESQLECLLATANEMIPATSLSTRAR